MIKVSVHEHIQEAVPFWLVDINVKKTKLFDDGICFDAASVSSLIETDGQPQTDPKSRTKNHHVLKFKTVHSVTTIFFF